MSTEPERGEYLAHPKLTSQLTAAEKVQKGVGRWLRVDGGQITQSSEGQVQWDFNEGLEVRSYLTRLML